MASLEKSKLNIEFSIDIFYNILNGISANKKISNNENTYICLKKHKSLEPIKNNIFIEPDITKLSTNVKKFIESLTLEILMNPILLRNLINNSMKKQNFFSYNEAKEVLFAYTKSVNIYGTDQVVHYSGKKMLAQTEASINHFNTEHIIPQSFFKSYAIFSEYSANSMTSDLHILYPANEELNVIRSNYKFAEISDYESEMINNGSEKYNYHMELFEPKENSKGNIARAIAYFYILYNKNGDDYFDITKVIDFNTLVIWNELDNVDLYEIYRNNVIGTCNYNNKCQGNNNLFIDIPELVYYAFRDKLNYIDNKIISKSKKHIYSITKNDEKDLERAQKIINILKKCLEGNLSFNLLNKSDDFIILKKNICENEINKVNLTHNNGTEIKSTENNTEITPNTKTITKLSRSHKKKIKKRLKQRLNKQKNRSS